MSFLQGWSPPNSVPSSVQQREKKSEPPPTDAEMREKVQHMIDLQYAAQQQALPTVNAPPPPSDPSPPKGGRSVFNVPYYTQAQEEATTANTEDGVGQGRIYFPSDYPKPPERQPMLPPHPTDYGASGGLTLGAAAAPVDDSFDPDYVEPKAHHHHHHHHSKCCQCCFKFVKYLMNAEGLHRSFCYGAIDGVLTGSGIVATFLGMKLLTPRAQMTVHVFCVAFSLAACTSDAICMGVGHVWNTYVESTASAEDRRTERLSFEQNRADAKGKLVDMLLSRGMLKIDAMSIADTLEGYPDIFVSALVGDSGFALEKDSLSSGGSSNALLGHHFHPEEGYPQTGGLRGHRSYGQFSEAEYDPESVEVKAAMGESRAEGLVMTLSFTLFSLLPSVNFLWLSIVMDDNPGRSGGTSVRSMTMTLTSIVMLLLGMWKSKFFEIHWALFGLETVLQLWLCIMAAYTIGAVLVAVIPGLDGLMSTNASHEL